MLKDSVMFMSGGSRGIGLAIATRVARERVKVALMAKTAEPHPRLPGTVYTAAEEIEAAGGEALPIVGDIRDAEAVDAAVAQTVEKWGGIDLVVNNASATFVVTRACLPHLRESDHAHVLTLSPPLSTDPRWPRGHSAYTLSKLGMTMITLGVAADEAEAGVGANCLWPRTIIATAAVQNLLGGDEAMARARVPAIVGDAAAEILGRDPRECTGNVFIDDEVLAGAGVTDLDKYSGTPDADLVTDIFVEDSPVWEPSG